MATVIKSVILQAFTLSVLPIAARFIASNVSPAYVMFDLAMHQRRLNVVRYAKRTRKSVKRVWRSYIDSATSRLRSVNLMYPSSSEVI